MSGDPSDEELEELRRKKMEQLQDRQEGEGAEEAREAQREQREAQKKAMLRKHLTDDARKRLNTIKMSKPEFGEQVEQQVVALAQSGRIQGRIDDEKMKAILKELQPDEQEYDIRRR
ncbi:MAG: DNA-binding protein [Haloarculaceae archaeon]